MAREHLNNLVVIGPMSKFTKYKTDQYGKTSVSFLVGVSHFPSPVRVSAKLGADWRLKQGETAKSVAITKGYMNGWITQDNPPQLKTNIGARESGVFFYNEQIHPYCQLMIEGIITSVNGEWANVECSYTAPGAKDKAMAKTRIVSVKFKGAVPQQAVGNLVVAVGLPYPKHGDQWYLHMVADYACILYGKK